MDKYQRALLVLMWIGIAMSLMGLSYDFIVLDPGLKKLLYGGAMLLLVGGLAAWTTWDMLRSRQETGPPCPTCGRR